MMKRLAAAGIASAALGGVLLTAPPAMASPAKASVTAGWDYGCDWDGDWFYGGDCWDDYGYWDRHKHRHKHHHKFFKHHHKFFKHHHGHKFRNFDHWD